MIEFVDNDMMVGRISRNDPSKVHSANSSIEGDLDVCYNNISHEQITPSLELDDDMGLSTEDWLYIERYSSARKIPQNSEKLVNNKESQSKSLTIDNENSGSRFKTPGGESVFKIKLDAFIPTFDLVGDFEEKIKYANYEINARPVRERRIVNIHKSP